MLLRLFTAAVLLTPVGVPAVRAPNPASKPATSAPAVWNIDKNHSTVGFAIRHFVSKVHGQFVDYKGSITGDTDQWQNSQIQVDIVTSSISTNQTQRDAHLRSNDFFAADSFPVISFRSTRIERSGDAAKIYGNLTIRGITKAVVLDGEFNGISKSAQGDRVGFDATTTINRMDYGVKWNRAAEAGGMMLSDEVKIEINVEAVRAKS